MQRVDWERLGKRLDACLAREAAMLFDPFDPDIGRPLEEVFARTWDRLTPEQQALIQRDADAHDCTVVDRVRAYMEETERRLQEDPEYRRAFIHKLDRQESPFGLDPTLRKET
jgi:hypothetical protein